MKERGPAATPKFYLRVVPLLSHCNRALLLYNGALCREKPPALTSPFFAIELKTSL